MRRKVFMVCFIAVLALSFFHTTDAKAALKDTDWDYDNKITKTESNDEYDMTFYAYPSKDGKEAWIYGISLGGIRYSVSIPKTINGRKVTRIGNAGRKEDVRSNLFFDIVEYWNQRDGEVYYIKKVTLPDTIEVIQPYTFSGFRRMESIKIPKNVTGISAYTFYNCRKLKKVVLPENLKELDPLAFCSCPALKTLKLSSRNKTFKIKDRFLISRKDNALVFAGAGGKTLKIPNGVKIIKKDACNNVTAPVVHLPASVRKLEEDALTSADIKDVTVAAGNRVFQKDGQCVYRKKDKNLAVVIVDENRSVRISDHVERITMPCSMVNYSEWYHDDLQNTIFPKNLKLLGYPEGCHITDAKNGYYTGLTPPELMQSKTPEWLVDYRVHPPVFHDVYVPKASVKAYKAWYKKYGEKDSVKWHTYDDSIPEISNIPETEAELNQY